MEHRLLNPPFLGGDLNRALIERELMYGWDGELMMEFDEPCGCHVMTLGNREVSRTPCGEHENVQAG